MAHLLGDDLAAAPSRDLNGGLHHRATAKRVIYLFMSGGPSHHDLWDYKPKMKELFGKDLPEEVRDGQRITGMTSKQKTLPVCPSKYKFTRYENNADGIHVSELLPHTATVVKDLCIVHSTFTEAINHDPAITYIQTGSQIPGRPSMGSWLSYGLGNINENLPGYVVMHAKSRFAEQSLFGRLWGSGFMPAEHQGVLLRSQGDPVLYLGNPEGISSRDRRNQLDALAALNRVQHQKIGDPEILSRIKQHEMAYRMQTSVPELMDLSTEPGRHFQTIRRRSETTRNFCRLLSQCPAVGGAGCPQCSDFSPGAGMLTEIFPANTRASAKTSTRLAPALIKDLKQRGMLDDTLVVWGGEFGRTAYCQGKLTDKTYGRDHHPRCFTTWLGGGGVKPGITYGKTDDFGYNIADADGNPIRPIPDKAKLTPGTMHIHDLNATILHLLGIDHKKLTYRYQGRDFRLTDVHGHVVHDLIA